MNKTYIETVRMMLEVAPAIFEGTDFAMKGGTAINFFAENMPRLSVDIDVVYTKHAKPRDEAIRAIADSLKGAKDRLQSRRISAELRKLGGGDEAKLFLRRGNCIVKVEVNHVFRGTIMPTGMTRLVPDARALFATDLMVPALALSELYGSKLVAAMDRQHPRDLFDVFRLYAGSGLTPEIIECFVCYLAGHNRPVHEVLYSSDLDMTAPFTNEFTGMTKDPITLDELNEVRSRLKADLLRLLEPRHRHFLLSLVLAEPDWSLMLCPHLAELPALRWKLHNLGKLKQSNRKKFDQQSDELRAHFKA